MVVTWHKYIFKGVSQTFWKSDSCPDFLFLELETSKIGYLLNRAKFQQDCTPLILDIL